MVENARKIEVKLPTRGSDAHAEHDASRPSWSGVDRETDLAVLKIDGKSLRRSRWAIPASFAKASW